MSDEGRTMRPSVRRLCTLSVKIGISTKRIVGWENINKRRGDLGPM